MKGIIVILILIWGNLCYAQEGKFQLFQGEYFHSYASYLQTGEESFEFEDHGTDTLLVVMKINTETGNVWRLQSRFLTTIYSDSSTKHTTYFGWVFVGDYDSLSLKGNMENK